MYTRALILSLVVAVAACDRTPSDPADGASDLAALLIEQAGGSGASPHSLPALLQSAIQRVFREQGAQAARGLVRDLRRAQDNARAGAGGEGQTETARRRAIEAAEIQIVLQVFGDDIASVIVTGVRADAVRLRQTVQEFGRNSKDATESLAEADELLFDAASALEQGAPAAALELGIRAGKATHQARLAILEATRVVTLSELYESASAQIRSVSTPSGSPLLKEHEQLLLTSRVALTGGNREASQKALDAVRASEIRIVLRTFGADAPRSMLRDADFALKDRAVAIARARLEERDVARLSRMHASARDLLVRAHASMQRGDPATALDLASHAAGLLNTVRLALY